jgi:hypothetical protein
MIATPLWQIYNSKEIWRSKIRNPQSKEMLCQ